jgi:Mg-chelatase subunit ChlD
MLAFDALAYDFPKEAKGKPQKFDDVTGSESWEADARNGNWGNFTQKPWLVYVVNEGAAAYNESRSSSGIFMTLDYLDDFYVADLQNGYALLFYSNVGLKNLTIPESCRKWSTKNNGTLEDGFVGWVRIDDLLLWSICPRTKDGVFKKIAVVKNFEKINGEDGVKKIPKLYWDAYCTIEKMSIEDLSFYFLFKENANGNAFVYKDYRIDGKNGGVEDKEMGWKMDAGWINDYDYIPWNTRVCWEVAFDDGSGTELNDEAITFKTKQAAVDLDMTKICSKSEITGNRKDPKFPRSPILDYNQDGVASMAVIGSSNGSSVSEERRMEAMNIINDLATSMSSINVVFVMDATRSMERSFGEMRDAVKKVSGYKLAQNINYGVVVYRNYDDEKNGDLFDFCPLTKDVKKIEDFFMSVKCKSVSPEPREAMFYGLDKAADMFKNPDESNFVILITDVSSMNPDGKGLTTESIAKKYAENRINLVAFQSAWNSKYSSDFGTQVKKIIYGIYSEYDGYTSKKYEVKKDSDNGVFKYYQKDRWPLRPMAFQIAEDGKASSNDLQQLVVGIILDFVEKTEDNIYRLKALVGSDNIFLSLFDGLEKKGLRESDLKGMIKVQAYSEMYNSNGKQMFVPCLFMTDKELSELIDELRYVLKDKNNLEMQRQCKKLVLSYSGQLSIANKIINDISNSEMEKLIQSIEKECNYTFDDKVKRLISNSQALTDAEFGVLCKMLDVDISKLEKLRGKFYLPQNGHKYYYILLEDMPLITKQ